MAEYIDLDTPLEVYRYHGYSYEPFSTTLREFLDGTKVRYEVVNFASEDELLWNEHFVVLAEQGCKTPKTNADSIRSMDIDQLIEWYCYKRPCGTCPYNGVECVLREWLNHEVTA